MSRTLIEQRRADSKTRLTSIGERMGSWEPRVAGKACVYVTGSFGREEANAQSDLDLFIIGDKAHGRPQLQRLDQICLKADLITATRVLHFPEFDADGEYLAYHDIIDLTGHLGHADDDSRNTLTARLLLLLESKPLVGTAFYDVAIREVIAKYWEDFERHSAAFIPAFLSNDILRLWRTFCVNYEARTQRDPEDKRAKRRLKNYKLKHSRLITCFSALAELLVVHTRANTVTPANAHELVARTPTERLEWIKATGSAAIASRVDEILQRYSTFLEYTARPELPEEFRDRALASARISEANRFGDAFFELLQEVGRGSTFYRFLVV